MEKIKGVLVIIVVVGITYGYNYHFEDLMLWLSGETKVVPEVPQIGPFN